jgi:ABC-2 type transport system ATP-binding protein
MNDAPDRHVVVQASQITKRYGDLVAVNRLSLEVYEGEILGLLGPNGAGKTTTIHILCGLLRPDGGQVFVGGKTLQAGGVERRKMVGMCPQSITLWEKLTCIEQLQFIGEMYGLPAGEARQRGERLLDEMGLADKRSRLASTLSGGMQRRLNLIMALVHDPGIVVLDEAEAGLDPQSRILVRDYIRSLARRKTVILTTHNMDEADRVADRVAIIDHGELLVVDTPAHLKQRLGGGDVIEIRLDGGEKSQEQVGLALETIASRISLDEATGQLRIQALDAMGKLPLILEKLAGIGVHPQEMSVRANTLEDVFIQLTGRRLRE